MRDQGQEGKAGNRLQAYLLAIAGSLLIIGLGIIFNTPLKREFSGNPAPENRQKEKKLTSADYLKGAKRALADKSKANPFGKINEATILLTKIESGDANFHQAQELLKGINGLKQKIEAQARQKRNDELNKNRRISYAGDLAKLFSEEGYDIGVATEGGDASVLKLKGAPASRSLISKLIKERSLLEAWRYLGFQRVLFSDGIRSVSYVDLRRANPKRGGR